MQKHIPAPKARMVRKQVYITAEQDRRLKELAKAEGVPAADIVRRGLQQAIELNEDANRLSELKAYLRTAEPIWQDRDDMQQWLRDLRKGWSRREQRNRSDAGKG
jgi:predicted DNA-binding protein